MRWLLILQEVATGLTGLVLLVAPNVIPSSAGLQVNHDGRVLCYLIAANEQSLAFLSRGAVSMRDMRAAPLIGWFFLVFHGLSALAGLLGVVTRASRQLLGNVIVHVGLSIFFIAFVAKTRPRRTAAFPKET